MSAIQWTDETWNPTVGCSKVSPGCTHCYAERLAASGRLQQLPVYQGIATDGQWTGTVRCVPERLEQPLRWRKPRRVFVNSMSDLFHPDVPDNFILEVFGIMAVTQRHTYQVLTKRPERANKWLRMFSEVEGAKFHNISSIYLSECADRLLEHYTEESVEEMERRASVLPWPLPNVWLGVSVEDQKRADERIPVLLNTPAAVCFVSCEPLLGPLKLHGERVHMEGGVHVHDGWDYRELDWVIVGGESGQGARPCTVEWIEAIVDECRAAEVPVFVKQLGSNPQWPPVATDTAGRQYYLQQPLLDRKGGNPAEWPQKLQVREYPEVKA